MEEKYIWQDIYKRIHKDGKLVKPREQTVLEVENFSYELPPYVRFPSFVPRNLKISYIKEEFRWYLNGDPYDLSICDKASIWKNMVHKGRLNSNYGLYFFRMGGFKWVLRELNQDRDSRRAYIPILDHTHLLSETKDVPCTQCVGFRIRDNKLNMSVRMRSQDMIYGLGGDSPAFSFLHEMVYNALLVTYPELQLGSYHHVSDSAHIYERHFALLEKLVSPDVEFIPIVVPRIAGPLEVVALTLGTYPTTDFEFSKWLISS